MVQEKDLWPSMIWNWLTDLNLLRRYGSNLWRLVPDDWHGWWICAVTECIPPLADVTLASPIAIFSDITDRKEEFELSLKDDRAAEMKRVCNNHLMPLVWCPWGCSEFYHKCETVSLDLVMRKLFGSLV